MSTGTCADLIIGHLCERVAQLGRTRSVLCDFDEKGREGFIVDATEIVDERAVNPIDLVRLQNQTGQRNEA